MRTWMILVFSAIVAAGTAFAIASSLPPEPDVARPTPARDAAATTRLAREYEEVCERVAVLEALVHRQSGEMETLRNRLAVEGAARPDVAAAPATESPEAVPGDAASRANVKPEEVEAVVRQITDKARRQAQDGLRALLEPTPEYEKRSRDRIVQNARKLGVKFKLPSETTRAIAIALLEADKVGKERIRNELGGRDLSAITIEDVHPLVKSMFNAREKALESYLDREQLDSFRKSDAAARTQYEEWLKIAFPSRGR
jgi:hypothetical protein